MVYVLTYIFFKYSTKNFLKISERYFLVFLNIPINFLIFNFSSFKIYSHDFLSKIFCEDSQIFLKDILKYFLKFPQNITMVYWDTPQNVSWTFQNSLIPPKKLSQDFRFFIYLFIYFLIFLRFFESKIF